MPDAQGLPSIEGPTIQRVVLVDRLLRPEVKTFESYSLPGQTIQLMISGRVRQEVDGRDQDYEPGAAIWYNQNELVRTEMIEAPWDYYTVNFFAPTIIPPPYEHRLKHVGTEVVEVFDRLLRAWRDVSAGPMLRHMRTHSALLDLLGALLPEPGSPYRIDPATELWWNLESRIRADLSRPLDLHVIQKLTGRSLRTIIRSCHCAVNMPPMQRVKQLRLSMARGLVLYSDLTFTEIARRVGYARGQEFSRDYHKEFDITPSKDRARGPDYRSAETHGSRAGRHG